MAPRQGSEYEKWLRVKKYSQLHNFLLQESLPASAECPVKLHQTLILVSARLGERQLLGIQRSLAIQHFKIGRRTAFVAHVRQADRLLQIRDAILQAQSHLMQLLIADERIGDVAESSLNGLPVSDQGLLVLAIQPGADSRARRPR